MSDPLPADGALRTPAQTKGKGKGAKRSGGLRLMVYDRNCRGRRARPGLSHAWWAGAKLYRSLGRLDAHCGVDSWEEALEFLAEYRSDLPLAEVQYWGHGKWGGARVQSQHLDRSALQPDSPLYGRLKAVANRMLPDGAGLWWFRTCETFGARPGHDFAAHMADVLEARVAGHTYIIGHIQSGLHTVRPGQTPDWPVEEGVREGSPDAPLRAYWSRWRAPNTITCLRGTIPNGY